MTTPDLLDHFAALEDPRQSWKTRHPLDEILLIVLGGVMAGADDLVEIALWGKRKLDWLRRFLPFEHGVPSHDTLNDVMNALPKDFFGECFTTRVASLREGTLTLWPSTARPRAVRMGRMAARCIWSRSQAARQRLVLGQERCDAKANEISAIPRLLERLELRGALVTIDGEAVRGRPSWRHRFEPDGRRFERAAERAVSTASPTPSWGAARITCWR